MRNKAMSFECRLITADDCLPLRAEVLRAGRLAPEACRFPLDAESVHWGAFRAGELVSIVSAHREERFGEPEAWRIRGMATAPALQGTGAGAAVLGALLSWARGREIPLLWCNARVRAIPFYEREGFTVESELFEIDGVGPHKVMKTKP